MDSLFIVGYMPRRNTILDNFFNGSHACVCILVDAFVTGMCVFFLKQLFILPHALVSQYCIFLV